MEVIDNIPVKLELDDVVKKTRLRNVNEDVKEIIHELFDMVRPIAKPKAVFEISCVDNKQGDSLDIGGIRFTSHVLRVNSDKVERVFPYIVTCGREIDEIKIPQSQLLKQYFLDQIKEITVRSALSYLHDYIRANHAC
ncbi:MAG: hypothetical protein H8E40_12480 [Chloroflexi bacterium]|nr:hypothetical protein [Chloroflexota bacterium]